MTFERIPFLQVSSHFRTINRRPHHIPLTFPLMKLVEKTLTTTPTWIMRQAGRYLPEYRDFMKDKNFYTVCRTPALACEVTMMPIRRYKSLLNAAIIFSDITIVFPLLGSPVEMVPGHGPCVKNSPSSPSDLPSWACTKDASINVYESELKAELGGKLGYLYEAIGLVRNEREMEGKSLIGFVGGPFTLLTYLLEGGGSRLFSKTKKWMYAWGESAHMLLRGISEVLKDVLVRQAEAGCDHLMIFESHANILTTDGFKEFLWPYAEDICRHVKMRTSASIGIFSRGSFNDDHLLTLVCSCTAVDVLCVDWTVDMKKAAKIAHSHGKVLQGNMDPGLLYADKETIYSSVSKMVKQVPCRYIASLGHGMYPDHDAEHLQWFLEAVRTSALTDSNCVSISSVNLQTDRRTRLEAFFLDFQRSVCDALNLVGGGTIVSEPWYADHVEAGHGRGLGCRLEDSPVFERASVNFSQIWGLHLPQSAEQRGCGSGGRYWAAGVSMIFHPSNPFVPTAHCNFRYFETDSGKWWMGGCVDMTPYYLFRDDVSHFHRTLQDACGSHYDEFSKNADEYFYLPHRKERRGIGGIFFDSFQLNNDFDITFECVEKMSRSVIPAYVPIVRKHKDSEYTEQQRDWQLHRRGRYVEFNLLIDRGTKFGMRSKFDRAEAVLVSMPPLCKWSYQYAPSADMEQEKDLIHVLTSSRPPSWTLSDEPVS